MISLPNASSEELVRDAMTQLAVYSRKFPEETAGLKPIEELLARFGIDAFSRANMAGHVTTSGLVYDAKTDQVLMIHHLVLDRWLQPGGHHEGLAPLYESAAREVAEETGVVVTLSQSCELGVYLIDVDTHCIPANESKGERAHVHHDFLYLFEGDSSMPLNPQWEEVTSARWMPSQFLGQVGSIRLERVLAKLL